MDQLLGFPCPEPWQSSEEICRSLKETRVPRETPHHYTPIVLLILTLPSLGWGVRNWKEGSSQKHPCWSIIQVRHHCIQVRCHLYLPASWQEDQPFA